MKKITLIFVLFLASCKSIDQIETIDEIFQGQSAGYVLIPINDDLDSGYLITQGNERFLVYGLSLIHI